MKTLKQIREEYNSRFVPPMEIPEELMLEGADKGRIKTISVIPSNREMPPILIFRRLTWKTYPNRQVVALYYSKILDKYLSIPFGPTGNLNLSESKIYDSLEELEEGVLSTLDTAADYTVPYYSAGKKALKGDFKGAAVDAGIDTATLGAAALTGGLGAGGAFAARTAARAAAKGAASGAAKSLATHVAKRGAAKTAGTLAKYGIKKAKAGAKSIAKNAAGNYIANKLTGGGEGGDGKQEIKITQDSGPKLIGGYAHGKEPKMLKRGNAFSGGVNKGDATFQSKLKSATMKDMAAQKKSLAENRVSDLRKMIKEGIDQKDLQINGRTVSLNRNMAKKIVEVYDSVNVINKRKIESMLNENLESFKKLLNFSIKQ